MSRITTVFLSVYMMTSDVLGQTSQPQSDMELRAVFDAFVTAAAKSDTSAVEPMLLKIDDVEQPAGWRQTLAAIENGLFDGVVVRTHACRVVGDCGVLVNELRPPLERPRISMMLAVRVNGKWLLLRNDRVIGTRMLSQEQQTRIEGLKSWFNEQAERIRFNPPTAQDRARQERLAELNGAIMTGNATAVRALLANGVDPNAASMTGERPILLAASGKSVDVLRILLDAGASVNPRRSLESPLHGAIRDGRIENALLLIERGVRLSDPGLRTQPLHDAATAGMSAVVRRMIEKGAKPDDVAAGWPLLHAAASSGDYATFAAVRPLYPDVTVKGRYESTALHAVATSLRVTAGRDRQRITQDLLAGGVDPHATASGGIFGRGRDTALRVAVQDGQGDVLLTLLDRVEYPRDELTSALFLATGSPLMKFDVYESLIRHGASVKELADKKPESALHRVVGWGGADPAIVKLLLDAGHPIDSMSEVRRRTPLHTAVARSNAQIVRFLLNRGADRRILDADGHDALALAKIRVQSGRESPRRLDVRYYPEPDGQRDEGKQVLEVLTSP